MPMLVDKASEVRSSHQMQGTFGLSLFTFLLVDFPELRIAAEPSLLYSLT